MMRSRALALAGVLAVAAGPALVTAPAVAKTKTAKKHHAGQTCSPRKKVPKGFTCKLNKKGKYVLMKSKK
jgi:hypothetical protein